MQQSPATNPFLKQQRFKVNPTSIVIFLVVAFTAWELNVFGELAFPSLHWLPYFTRTTITLLADFLLIFISLRLLEKNQIPANALGLAPKIMFPNVLFGFAIGVGSLALIEGLLYTVTPYTFQHGPLHGTAVLQEAYSYCVGNALEELMFRGFLLVIVSRFTGWKIAALVMALPFGLFHLQGLGNSMEGWRMVASTAIYSLVFSLSYILTASMWTAISAHVTSNTLLHVILGLDGMHRAMFVQVFSESNPKRDGIWALIVGSLVMSCLLYLAVSFKFKNTAECKELV